MKDFKFLTVSRFTLLMLAVVCISACHGGDTQPTSYQEVERQVSEYIQAKMAEDQVIGVAIGLVDGDNLVWAQGFGLAGTRTDSRVTTDTVFEIGSLTKTMTSVLVMKQVEQGSMDLDAPLSDYIPEWSINQRFPESAPITIRSLLTHHSGVPGDVLPGAFSLTFDPQGFTEWLLNELAGDYTAYPVNYRQAYSNSGLTLVGQALANVCGDTLIQCGDRLLADLGMPDSSFWLRPDLEPRLSPGYYLGQDVGRYYCNFPATGGVYSTVPDMAQYISFILGQGRGVLQPSSVREMLTIQNNDIPLDLDVEMGLTWFLSDTYAGLLASHTGGTVAHWSQILILPAQGLGVVVLTNSKTGLELITGASYLAMQLAVSAKTGLEKPDEPQPEYSPHHQATQEELAAAAGVYATGRGIDFFSVSDQGLTWTTYGQDESVDLILRQNGWFSPPDHQDYQLEFTAISGRSVIVLHVGDDSSIYAQKYDPETIDQGWIDRAGSYRLTDLPADDMSHFVPPDLRLTAEKVDLGYVDGLLLLNTGTFGLQLLRPLNGSLAEFFGLGRNGGTVVRADGNRLSFLGTRYVKEE